MIGLAQLMVHSTVVTALQIFNETGIKSLKALSNAEIGANPNIFNIAIDDQGAPWIIPKDVQKTRRVHFRDKLNPSTTANYLVEDMIFVSEKHAIFISSKPESAGVQTTKRASSYQSSGSPRTKTVQV